MKTELAIIGAGPAGLSAAIEAAKNGVSVTVLDENIKPGGQLFKQIHRFFGSEEHLAGIRGFDIGNILLRDAEKYKVNVLVKNVVWGIFPDLRLGISDGDTVDILDADKIIIASGALENSLSFPGWTLPNIMGAGAAQTMVNVNRVLPGSKVLTIGSGNVGLIVSYQLVQAGAEVVALVEALPEIGGYQVHASKITRMGVPILTSHTIMQVHGETSVESVDIAKIDEKFNIIKGTEINLDVDLVCIAVGLRPLAELCWMVGIKSDYVPELGGFVPIHDENMQTTLPGVYVAGDVTGIEEASTAMEEGKLASISVSMALNKIDKKEGEAKISEAKQRLRSLRLGPFGKDRYIAKGKIINSYHSYV